MRMNGGCRPASEPVQRACCTVGSGSALGRSSNPGLLLNQRTSQRTILMMRKFAIALIATTMLVAPALAADAVKSTPPAAVTQTKTDKDIKKTKVAHRHSGRHLAMVKHGKHSGSVKTAKHATH